MNYTVEELFNAFTEVRDALPETHERRKMLSNITSLQYDTLTPGVVYMRVPDRRLPHFRRLSGSSLDEVATNMVLFPMHHIIQFEFDKSSPDYATILQMPASRREKEGIYDIFISDWARDRQEISLILLVKRSSEDDEIGGKISDILGGYLHERSIDRLRQFMIRMPMD